MVEIYLPKQEGKLLAVGLRGDLQLPDDVRILKDAEKELENAIHHLGEYCNVWFVSWQLLLLLLLTRRRSGADFRGPARL